MWSLLWIRQLRAGWVAVNVIPLIVLSSIWGLAYGPRSFEAFHQLRQLSIYAPRPSLGFREIASYIAARDARLAVQNGGFTVMFVLVALAAGFSRLVHWNQMPGEESAGAWRSCVLRLFAIVLLQAALVQFLIPGPGYTRIVMVVPFAAVCLSLSVSHLAGSSRMPALVGLALIVLSQLGVTAGYLGELRHMWHGRRPQRFDALVEAIPPDARVVAVPELWYAFQSHNRRLALIYHADDEYEYWTDTAGALDPYDVVILDPQAPEYGELHDRASAGRPVEVYVKDATGATIRSTPAGWT